MAKKYVGDIVKEARTNAKMTQEALAKKVKGMTAQDIGKIERNELAPTNDQLKLIAKATGVTQKSLLEAPKKISAKPASNKTSSAKTNQSKKTASSSNKKTEAATASGTSVKVSASEKKMLELYRKADADTKKAALAILKGEKSQTGTILESILSNKKVMDAVSGFLK